MCSNCSQLVNDFSNVCRQHFFFVNRSSDFLQPALGLLLYNQPLYIPNYHEFSFQAIEQIKDSPLLYNNRALTYIKLNVYDKAKEDLNWALRLNEDSLKSWLLLAKINLLEGNMVEYEKSIREAIERNPDKQEFIISKFMIHYRIVLN